MRAELFEIADENSPLSIATTNDKEDLMIVIDKEIAILTSLFNKTMEEFSKKLKTYRHYLKISFVNDNLISVRNIKLLFKAV